MSQPTTDERPEEPTIDWLIEQIAPNKGNSPLLNFNKKRLKAKIQELYVLKSDVEEAIESARVDGMFIEWNGMNLMDIADFRTRLNLNKES